MKRLVQAVILAGGRGTRMMPITQEIPKPMVSICGRPFLEYLLEMLVENGIQEIVLLLGYKAEKVIAYFGDGKQWGVNIVYSVTNVNDDTGRRLILASEHLQDEFLLLYCDNYWPLQLGRMLEYYRKKSVPALVTVYVNKNNITKNNMLIDDAGFVSVYDKSRTQNGLKGVDIGFFILNKKVLSYLPEDNFSLEKELYPQLIERNELVAYETEHQYYSIGSIDRLGKTEAFFNNIPTVFLDRDGVINKKPPVREYVTSWDDWHWKAGSKEAIQLLSDNGYRVVIITNQAGVSRGMLSKHQLDNIHSQMKLELASIGGEINAIYYCPHGWDDNCDCRKPAPGMFYQAQKDFDIDLTKAVYFGDEDKDEKCAKQVGCSFFLIEPNMNLADEVKKYFNLDGSVNK